MADKGGLLRLYKAENSVLLPVGKELCRDHPLLGRKRARDDENSRASLSVVTKKQG